MSNIQTDLLVVGAGISGLFAAREMVRAGRSCLVLDKGSRPGGRMATRPLSGNLADYGAQYLELRSDAARVSLKEWVTQGIVRPWTHEFPGELESPVASSGGPIVPKHFVPGGMNQLPAHLASGLDVRLRQEVSRIQVESQHWVVECRTGERYTAGALLLTAPLPQCLRLLEQSEIPFHDSQISLLRTVQYDPCFTLIARLDGPSGVPCPGGVFPQGGSIAWIGDNHQKGLSGEATVLTVHSTALFAQRHFDDDPQRVTGILVDGLRSLTQAAIEETHLHRWRYARVRNPIASRSVQLLREPALVLAGDAFGGKDIEAAILSGIDAVHWVVRNALTRSADLPAGEVELG